jgi:hypothetical protein
MIRACCEQPGHQQLWVVVSQIALQVNVPSWSRKGRNDAVHRDRRLAKSQNPAPLLGIHFDSNVSESFLAEESRQSVS